VYISSWVFETFGNKIRWYSGFSILLFLCILHEEKSGLKLWHPQRLNTQQIIFLTNLRASRVVVCTIYHLKVIQIFKGIFGNIIFFLQWMKLLDCYKNFKKYSFTWMDVFIWMNKMDYNPHFACCVYIYGYKELHDSSEDCFLACLKKMN